MLPDVTDFCRLVLMRHPELDEASGRMAVGSGPAQLSRRGKARVLEWMDLLQDVPVDVVCSSDQPQAHGPAAGVARAKGLEVTVDDRLCDQNMGEWQGRPWDDVVESDQVRVTEFFERFADHVPPDGESLGGAVERVLEWWRESVPREPGKTVVAIAAGSLISGFVAAMLGMRLSRCLSVSLPHGGIGVLDVFQNGVRISGWNIDSLA